MSVDQLFQKILQKKARVGIIGLGYVGLPLVLRFCEEDFRVLGFDVDSKVPLPLKILPHTERLLHRVDGVVVVTDHSHIDYP
jgi:UDP-N-acetyl-D-mannosaminuronate dehydrogenase